MLFVDYPDQPTRTVIACLQLIAYVNCAINPVVYCLLNERFQLHMRKTVGSLVRLLTTRGQHSRRRRVNTISETLHRAANGLTNYNAGLIGARRRAVEKAQMERSVVDGTEKPVLVRPIDTLEMNGEQHARLSDKPTTVVNAGYNFDNESQSTDELGGPFTPSTEELPVASLFDDSDQADETKNNSSIIVGQA